MAIPILYMCDLSLNRIELNYYSIFVCRYEQALRKRNKDVRIRCLPYFYVAGVKESGVDDIFSAINTHPQILEPACSKPQFWNKARFKGRSDLFCNSFGVS